MRLQIFRLLSTLVVLVIFLLSCDNPAALTPGSQHNNIVTGIFITNETSPDAIAVWGRPQRPNSREFEVDPHDCEEEECSIIPIVFSLDTPYPNPADGAITIQFKLPISSNVSLWIEPATWLGYQNQAILPVSGRREFQTEVLIDNRAMSAGSYSYRPDIRSICSGGDAPPGFYRVFLWAGDFLSWQDIYIYGPRGTNPHGLADYIFYAPDDCNQNRTFD